MPYKKIEKHKWDACIDRSDNGIIYAKTFYLDNITDHWDALVQNDYEAVMPLTCKRKWGIHYLYQPFFAPSLGIFGCDGFSTTAFLEAIPKKFLYWDFDLNEKNIIPQQSNVSSIVFRKRRNYFIDLNQSYENISKGYRRLATRMRKKALAAGITVERNVPPDTIINYYKEEYKHKHAKIPAESYARLTKCAHIAFTQENAQTYIARSAKGDVVAFYLLLVDNKFVYSLLGGSNEYGQMHGAFYLLTDTVLKENASQSKVFRFEGSDVPGIAFFDEQFGPESITYHHIKMNGLPFPLNLLKR